MEKYTKPFILCCLFISFTSSNLLASRYLEVYFNKNMKKQLELLDRQVHGREVEVSPANGEDCEIVCLSKEDEKEKEEEVGEEDVEDNESRFLRDQMLAQMLEFEEIQDAESTEYSRHRSLGQILSRISQLLREYPYDREFLRWEDRRLTLLTNLIKSFLGPLIRKHVFTRLERTPPRAEEEISVDYIIDILEGIESAFENLSNEHRRILQAVLKRLQVKFKYVRYEGSFLPHNEETPNEYFLNYLFLRIIVPEISLNFQESGLDPRVLKTVGKIIVKLFPIWSHSTDQNHASSINPTQVETVVDEVLSNSWFLGANFKFQNYSRRLLNIIHMERLSSDIERRRKVFDLSVSSRGKEIRRPSLNGESRLGDLDKSPRKNPEEDKTLSSAKCGPKAKKLGSFDSLKLKLGFKKKSRSSGKSVSFSSSSSSSSEPRHPIRIHSPKRTREQRERQVDRIDLTFSSDFVQSIRESIDESTSTDIYEILSQSTQVVDQFFQEIFEETLENLRNFILGDVQYWDILESERAAVYLLSEIVEGLYDHRKIMSEFYKVFFDLFSSELYEVNRIESAFFHFIIRDVIFEGLLNPIECNHPTFLEGEECILHFDKRTTQVLRGMQADLSALIVEGTFQNRYSEIYRKFLSFLNYDELFSDPAFSVPKQ